ncbi:MAG: polysaccharide pyruvyl transferase family protein [bacterium]
MENCLVQANSLYKSGDYKKAVEFYGSADAKEKNPPLAYFMAGKCLSNLGLVKEAKDSYDASLKYDDSNPLFNNEIERFYLKNTLIDNKTRIIWHFFPYTLNIGDSGSAAGIRHILKSQRSDLFFLSLSCSGENMNQIEQMSRHDPEMVIIGGGGLFFKHKLPDTWYFPLAPEYISSKAFPFVTYGTGLNQEYNNNPAWDLDRNFICRLAEYHKLFKLKSVRDTWTFNKLQDAGVNDLYLAACPSAFLEPLKWFNFHAEEKQKNIALCITIRSVDQSNAAGFIKIFIEFGKWLMRNGYNAIFVLHDANDDGRIFTAVTEQNFPCIIPTTAREAVTIYDKCGFVMGMRGHSLILGAGRNVPVFAISYNKKLDAFMELMGLEKYCVNQNKIRGSRDLINGFNLLVDDYPEIMSIMRKKRREFYTANMEYAGQIAGLFHDP